MEVYKVMRYLIVMFLFVCAACTSYRVKSGTDDIYSPEYISMIMKKVCDWQLAHPNAKNNTSSNGWARSAFYTGVMATYHTTHDEKYLDQSVKWCEKNYWKPGNRIRQADDQCCGQTYLEIYFLKKDLSMIAGMKEAFNEMIQNPRPGREEWYWCDALFMAPPVLARLGAATGEKKYFDFMNRMWWDTTGFLFDEDEGFYYRDKRFFDQRSSNGKKIFWSRGNGWVIAGLVRVLQHLPENDPYYEKFVNLYTQMSAAILLTQGNDGLWRTNLLDPDDAQSSETSGSGFFCYALAWGINNGFLDHDRFLPVVKKAWRGLVEAVHPDGKLGWVQQVGDRPADVTRNDNQEYGSGAFLLAGSEMYRLR